jgi:hypothetical protein
LVSAPAFLLTLLALAEPVLAQCSMCKSVVAQSPEGQAIAGELNKAILVMFAAPYLVFGSFTAYFFRGRIGQVVRRILSALVLPRF